MNETQLYSAIMFFAGVALTHTVFYFDTKRKQKRFYLILSSVILQMLDNIDLIHRSLVEFTQEQTKTLDETEAEEYLEKESQKLSVFMELYVLLLTNAVPKQGRKFINYKSWSEAKVLIKKLRGLMSEQNKR